MANAIADQVVILRGGTVTLMARLVNNDGDYITQASMSTITYTVFLTNEDYPRDPDDRTAVTGHEDVVVAIASAVFDALQTGGIWTKDATGYNFKYTIPISANAAFAVAGRSYIVEFTGTPDSGEKFKWHHQVDTSVT
jgi:hypothetical protein